MFFGIGRIIDKRELTQWLDDKVERFLSRMGDNIQATINNRLGSETLESLNKYGKKLLKRYRRYKKSHRG